MRGVDPIRSVGELVRLSDGAVWPLTLPITLIGSGSQCDVPLTEGPELMCALALTPAGLSLRSWNPDVTRVDGVATAAALLTDGRELGIGTDEFRLSWKPIVRTDDAELRDQLRIGREKFRTERKTIEAEHTLRAKRLDKDAGRLREGERALAAERIRVRAIYRRCILRIKTKWSAERDSASLERANHESSEARFRQFAERQRAELDRLAEQLAGDKARVQAAWELVAEGQRRAIEDRSQAEEWLARQREALDLRAKMFGEQRRLREANREIPDARQPALSAEITGLETRATNLRLAIAALEAKRDSTAAEGVLSFAPVALEPTRLSRGTSQRADSLLTELQERERELARERQIQSHLREELDTRACDLADQRAILVEQIAALTAARGLWHTAESQTVDELHALAIGVRSGEQSLDQRERDLYAAERRRRSDDHALVELRFKLENWQVALAAKEASVQSEADRLGDQSSAKQEQMDRWEATLGDTAASWAELRRREVEFLRAELDRLALARAEHAAAAADARQLHAELTAQLVEIAARDLARTGDKRGTTRRVRVLEKRWQAHFRREEIRLVRTEDRLRREREELDDRDRRVRWEADSVLTQGRTDAVARIEFDRDRLAAERRLHEARGEAELETHLRFRTEDDARRLRGEIAKMAQSILTANLTPPDEPDAIILPLKLVRAA